MSSTKVIVVGAGWSGLTAASTYLKINPNVSLTILDASDSPGGVWSKSRLYPGLLANSPSGLYEFSDLSMKGGHHTSHDPITGEDVQEYLHRYANFRGLYDKIKFGIQVVKITRKGASGTPNVGWDVHISTGEILGCDKLIVATGLHSKPKMPVIPQDEYTGVACIHSRDLGRRHAELSSNPSINCVAIVGGCKSAIEACTIFITAGKKVNWIIRPSEQGVPTAVIEDDAAINLVAVNNMRIFSILGPSIFDTASFWYRHLHGVSKGLGVWVRNKFWKNMTKVVTGGLGYQNSENGRKIQPTGDDLFYDAPYIGVLYRSHPFLKWVHDEDKVKVYRATPARLVGRQMEIVVPELSHSEQKPVTSTIAEKVAADAVIWCTGWEPGLDFFEDDEARILGLPAPLTSPMSTAMPQKSASASSMSTKSDVSGINTPTSSNTTLSSTDPSAPTTSASPVPSPDDDLNALQRIKSLFPQLGLTSPRPGPNPSHNGQPQPSYFSKSPFHLYNQLISPHSLSTNDHSIIFIGLLSTSQTAITSEIQSLWAVAWLEDILPRSALPRLSRDHLSKNPDNKPTDTDHDIDEEALIRRTNDVRAWMSLRYGYRTALEPMCVLEVQTYLDTLMRDLGLEVYRKRNRAELRKRGEIRDRTSQREGKGTDATEKASTPGGVGEEVQAALQTGTMGWKLRLFRVLTPAWLKEWIEPYEARDYRGVVDEFLEGVGRGRVGKEA